METATPQATDTPTNTPTNTPPITIDDKAKATAAVLFEQEAVKHPAWGTPTLLLFQEPDGGRLLVVRYYEKGRMEYDRDVGLTVTGGLLMSEILDGRINGKVGTPTPCVPNVPDIPMFEDTKGLTYQTFSNALKNLGPGGIHSEDATKQNTKGYASITINRYGEIGFDSSKQNLEAAKFVRKENGHSIPVAFCNYIMRYASLPSDWCSPSSSALMPSGFWDLTGYPITEPYWSTPYYDGHTHMVMFQAFQRRLLTYSELVSGADGLYASESTLRAPGAAATSTVSTPSASATVTSTSTATPMPTATPTMTPEITSGNVGIHYYKWRYPNDVEIQGCP
jgi:hypothetical protein